MMISPIATQAKGVRDPKNGWDRGTPWGLLLHTTGGGVTDEAAYEYINGRRTGKLRTAPLRPLDIAMRTYIDAQNGGNGYLWGGPGYVIDHDGTIYQLAPDNLNMQHAGGQNRLLYFNGAWTSRFPAATAAWRQKWSPRFNHPYELFPSTSPNHDYVGCEMIPCGDGFGTPMRPGLKFTQQQHDAAVALRDDLGSRHGWPVGWSTGARLLGHEDVDPLNRSDDGGGWDPGYLRTSPYFDFAYVRSHVP